MGFRDSAGHTEQARAGEGQGKKSALARPPRTEGVSQLGPGAAGVAGVPPLWRKGAARPGGRGWPGGAPREQPASAWAREVLEQELRTAPVPRGTPTGVFAGGCPPGPHQAQPQSQPNAPAPLPLILAAGGVTTPPRGRQCSDGGPRRALSGVPEDELHTPPREAPLRPPRSREGGESWSGTQPEVLAA